MSLVQFVVGWLGHNKSRVQFAFEKLFLAFFCENFDIFSPKSDSNNY